MEHCFNSINKKDKANTNELPNAPTSNYLKADVVAETGQTPIRSTQQFGSQRDAVTRAWTLESERPGFRLGPARSSISLNSVPSSEDRHAKSYFVGSSEELMS